MHDSLDPIKNNANSVRFYKFATVPFKNFLKDYAQIHNLGPVSPFEDNKIYENGSDELKKILTLKNFNNLELIDNKEKVFIFLTPQIFHFIVDNLQPILYHYKRNNYTKFIIDTSSIGTDHPPHLDMLEVLNRFLNYLEADYCFVDSSYCNIVLDNVFYHSQFGKTEKYLFEIQEIIKKCYNINNHVIPNKKIYISRSMVDIEREGDSRHDIRLYDSKILEDFLIENSFSIIFFENFLFQDRLNLLNETKLISGVSGSGMMGALFMQENQTVIEYSKMLPDTKVFGQKNLHFQYESLAYLKKHLFLSINSDLHAENLIKQIKNNKTLMSLISE